MSNDLIDVFPPDDRLTLFVIAMCAASNDVRDGDRAIRLAHPDNHEDEDQYHRNRYTSIIRRTLGYLYEGITALKAWRTHDAEAQRLLGKLSPEGVKNLKVVSGLEQSIGSKALRGTRNSSFHYPRPNSGFEPDPVGELAEAIRANPKTPAGFDQDEGGPGRLYRFADQLMLSMAFGEYDPDEEKAAKQVKRIEVASEAFVELTDEIFDLYCTERGLHFGT